MQDKVMKAIEDYNNRLQRINRMIARINEKNVDLVSVNEEIQLRTLESEKRLLEEFIEDLKYIGE